MTASIVRFIPSRRAAAVLALLTGSALSGCANLGDSFASGAFVDPAIYDYYDCKQLETERKSLESRSAELQGLIARADTGGVSGEVVGEIAYRNDYITARAKLKLLEENWRRNKCQPSPPAPAAMPAPDQPPARQKGRHPAARSVDAVH